MSVDDKSTYAPCHNMDYECLKIGADQQELVRVDSYMQGAECFSPIVHLTVSLGRLGIARF